MSGIEKHFLNGHVSVEEHATKWPQTLSISAGLLLLCLVTLGVITYLPAVDNSFISDDFTLLSMVKVLDQYPSYIVEATSEFFRSVTYVYFWICFRIFGERPELFYWSSIGLHCLISFLVYVLVRTVTGQRVAALTAAAFFTVYERHQEAVMWISAANELILTLNCVLFLILWERALSQAHLRRTNLALAIVVFALALFSKEAAVALVPLAALGMVLQGYTPREVLRKSMPLVAMSGLYVVIWLSRANSNFFVTDGHYAFGLHFLPVYFRSVARMLSAVLPFLLAFLLIRNHARPRNHGSEVALSLSRSLLFFAALLLLATAPYSFLTYLDHIPSRNTYFPSIGLAGINGILFASLWNGLSSAQSKSRAAIFLAVILTANVAYIWLRKDSQYVERAAPTRDLLEILNRRGFAESGGLPVNVCGFPLHPWIGDEAVAGFTQFEKKEVIFSEACEGVTGGTILRWEPASASYVQLR
jgi:hypothetical protein